MTLAQRAGLPKKKKKKEKKKIPRFIPKGRGKGGLHEASRAQVGLGSLCKRGGILIVHIRGAQYVGGKAR
jgi:hypothetical protein